MLRMRSRTSTSLTRELLAPGLGDHRFLVDQLLEDLPVDAELPQQLLVHLAAVGLPVGVHLRV